MCGRDAREREGGERERGERGQAGGALTPPTMPHHHPSTGKAPVQAFFTEELGMPLTMNPDLETLACEMVFGATPPPLEADPVAGAGCLGECPTGRGGGGACWQLGGGGAPTGE